MKRQIIEWEKIFSNHRLNKENVSKLYKELLQLNKINNWNKMGKWCAYDVSQKKCTHNQ